MRLANWVAVGNGVRGRHFSAPLSLVRGSPLGLGSAYPDSPHRLYFSTTQHHPTLDIMARLLGSDTIQCGFYDKCFHGLSDKLRIMDAVFDVKKCGGETSVDGSGTSSMLWFVTTRRNMSTTAPASLSWRSLSKGSVTSSSDANRACYAR